MRPRTGWQAAARNNNKLPDLPSGPSDWELLLYRLNIKETEAAKSAKAREWIRANCHRRYVPERILEQLSIVVDV